MNTNYLKYFIALYRTGNMHKAAEEMYISQQGLSRIIQMNTPGAVEHANHTRCAR